MLHLGVADCVGQNPVVSTRTFKSTLYKFACNENLKNIKMSNALTIYNDINSEKILNMNHFNTLYNSLFKATDYMHEISVKIK